MEKKYYNVQDVADLTGTGKSKAYDLIRKCNKEIKSLYEGKPENEKPVIISGRVNKVYFDKKMEVSI